MALSIYLYHDSSAAIYLLFIKRATKEFVFTDAAKLIFVNAAMTFQFWFKKVNTEVGLSAVNFVTMKVNAPMFLSATQQISVFMNMDKAVFLSTVNGWVHYAAAVPFCFRCSRLNKRVRI
jgi:hypothetical protein